MQSQDEALYDLFFNRTDVAMIRTNLAEELSTKTITVRRPPWLWPAFVPYEEVSNLGSTGPAQGASTDPPITFQMSDLKLINAYNFSGFPFLSSTILYPEWAFGVVPLVDGKVTIVGGRSGCFRLAVL